MRTNLLALALIGLAALVLTNSLQAAEETFYYSSALDWFEEQNDIQDSTLITAPWQFEYVAIERVGFESFDGEGIAQLKNLSQLKAAHFRNCDLQAAASLMSTMQDVEAITLDECTLSEGALRAIAKLPKLDTLILSLMGGSFEWLDALRGSSSLRKLHLFTDVDTLPKGLLASFGALEDLRIVLGDNYDMKSFVEEFKAAPKLKKLHLYAVNALTAELHSYLKSANSLRSFGFFTGGVSKALIAAFSELTQLEELAIAKPETKPLGPLDLSPFKKLTNLKALSLAGISAATNKSTLDALRAMKDLKVLNLSNTGIWGAEFTKAIPALEGLEALYAAGCELNGIQDFAAAAAANATLKRLCVAFTEVARRLPAVLAKKHWKVLDVSHVEIYVPQALAKDNKYRISVDDLRCNWLFGYVETVRKAFRDDRVKRLDCSFGLPGRASRDLKALPIRDLEALKVPFSIIDSTLADAFPTLYRLRHLDLTYCEGLDRNHVAALLSMNCAVHLPADENIKVVPIRVLLLDRVSRSAKTLVLSSKTTATGKLADVLDEFQSVETLILQSGVDDTELHLWELPGFHPMLKSGHSLRGLIERASTIVIRRPYSLTKDRYRVESNRYDAVLDLASWLSHDGISEKRIVIDGEQRWVNAGGLFASSIKSITDVTFRNCQLIESTLSNLEHWEHLEGLHFENVSFPSKDVRKSFLKVKRYDSLQNLKRLTLTPFLRFDETFECDENDLAKFEGLEYLRVDRMPIEASDIEDLVEDLENLRELDLGDTAYISDGDVRMLRGLRPGLRITYSIAFVEIHSKRGAKAVPGDPASIYLSELKEDALDGVLAASREVRHLIVNHGKYEARSDWHRKRSVDEEDYQKLSSLSNLEYVRLHSIRGIDTAFLTEFKSAEDGFSLELINCAFALEDIDFGILDNLGTLRIDNVHSLKPKYFSKPEDLEHLHTLILSGDSDWALSMEMVKHLAKLPALRVLEVRGHIYSDSHEDLAKLSQLAELRLDCSVRSKDIKALATSTSLEKLIIMGAHIEQVSSEDFQGFQQLSSLTFVLPSGVQPPRSLLRIQREGGRVLTPRFETKPEKAGFAPVRELPEPIEVFA